ncbi:hypothetical protein HLH33_16675 [Gluconacetobacter diazotrophicus]|uniref:Uncharacterized protein n=1 Tax=Gluconacetobacter diazotrophicus TaxID=33996 RepID=A0A7W4I7W4_GLUDI|nr:hypothetical protein [Gluconacetobacter diazotrophicus]MBB2157915.1 hypothetical protein [Gluconacetobacter diazotrophicus]
MSVVACWGGVEAPFQFAGRQPIARDDRDPTMASYTAGHLGFHGWMRAVDHAIARRIGLGVFDLPDRCWRDAYEERVLPRDAALEALEEEGCPLD